MVSVIARQLYVIVCVTFLFMGLACETNTPSGGLRAA